MSALRACPRFGILLLSHLPRALRAAIVVFWLSLCISSSGVAGETAATGADPAREYERITQEARKKQGELKRVERKERSVLADLESLDRSIQSGRSDLAEQQRRLKEAEASLDDIMLHSVALGGALADAKSLYGQRLRALYKMRHTGQVYAINGLGGLMKQIKYLSIIANRDQSIVNDYGSAMLRLSEQQATIASKKEEIVRHRQAVQLQKAELEANRRKKSVMLSDIRQEKGARLQTLRELEEASASLWEMIKRDSPTRQSQSAAAPAGRTSASASIAKGSLLWPLTGQLLTSFGMQRHPQFGTPVFRRGIEIQAQEGQDVHAAADGAVAYADWYKGYGRLVILDHGAGYYTLYGNLSRVDHAKGDRVARGQQIGQAGDTGSLKGAKLYFEFRKDGEAQDPVEWLAKR